MWSRSQQKDVVFALLLVLRWIPLDEEELQRRQSSIEELVSKVAEAMEMDEYWVWCAMRQIEDPDATNHLDVLELLDIYKKCENSSKKTNQVC
jgi:hypothetical protein